MERAVVWLFVIGLAALVALPSHAQPVPQEPAPPPATTPTPTPEPVEASPAAPTAGTDPAAGLAPHVATLDARATPGPAQVEPGDDDSKRSVPWIAALDWMQSYSVAGLVKGSTQTYNPTYAWGFRLTLGYVVDEFTTVTLLQPWSVELTKSDLTNSRQEWWLLDTALDVTHTFADLKPAPGQEWRPAGSIRLLVPTSKLSQARTVVLGTRVQGDVSYTYERLLSGLDTDLRLSYLHYFTNQDTVQTDMSFPCVTVGKDASERCTGFGGPSVAADILVLGFSAGVSLLPELRLGIDLSLWWNRALSFEPATLPIESGTVSVGDRSTTHWRNTRTIIVSADYSPTDWFTVSAGFWNDFAEVGPDGKLRGPFHAIDTLLTLGVRVSFDQLYLQGHAKGPRRSSEASRPAVFRAPR